MDENNSRYCYVTAVINSFVANYDIILLQYWKDSEFENIAT